MALFISSLTHAAPLSCVDLLTPDLSVQGQIALKVQKAIPEKTFELSEIFHTSSLKVPINLANWPFNKPAELNLIILSDSNVQIIISPKNPDHLDLAMKKADEIFTAMRKEFDLPLPNSDLTAPGAVTVQPGNKDSILVKIFGLSSKKIDMLTYFTRKFLKLTAYPQREYWTLERDELRSGNLIHIPAHLKEHQPLNHDGNIHFNAPFYARPQNIPRRIRDFFDFAKDYKLILNSDVWIIEARYKTPNGGLKTLMLKALPGDDSFEILNSTPYETEKPISAEENIYFDLIGQDLFTLQETKDSNNQIRLRVRIDLLVFFFEDLEGLGYKLDVKKYAIEEGRRPRKKSSLDDNVVYLDFFHQQ